MWKMFWKGALISVCWEEYKLDRLPLSIAYKYSGWGLTLWPAINRDRWPPSLCLATVVARLLLMLLSLQMAPLDRVSLGASYCYRISWPYTFAMFTGCACAFGQARLTEVCKKPSAAPVIRDEAQVNEGADDKRWMTADVDWLRWVLSQSRYHRYDEMETSPVFGSRTHQSQSLLLTSSLRADCNLVCQVRLKRSIPPSVRFNREAKYNDVQVFAKF